MKIISAQGHTEKGGSYQLHTGWLVHLGFWNNQPVSKGVTKILFIGLTIGIITSAFFTSLSQFESSSLWT